MPESPKFLMSTGKNEEALRLKNLLMKLSKTERKPLMDIQILLKKSIVEGLYQIKPLFCRPHLSKLVHVCANAVLILMSLNTLKLWFPQLFQAINDYEFTHNGSSSNMCDMLDTLKTKNATSSICAVNLDNSSVYINAIIIGMTSMLVFGIAGTLVNLLGKKGLTVYMALIAGFCATSLYFAQNSYTVLVLSAIFLSFGAVCGNVLVTITLELFPTPLRAMALSFYFMFARSGSLIGNMVFPTLLTAGCLPPFLFVGAVMFGCAGLTFLYPNTENKALTYVDLKNN
ncbi:hypothetical protein NQ317_019408 [Molorchus minor]|uniref:Major facilitator superfamily (MFS) profile domain-containing protein n=1 Tax=Molorchus minor TaxID=1323400 RepID=A0ABQ9JHP5_9CUCU|nr:hypothetical protein NQ317_019408 [Molorchus minor]